MTTPQQPPGPADHPGSDPTGMSALLRSLPDPGPMPDELVKRIQLSLAAETGPFARRDSQETGYTPVADIRGRSRRSGFRPIHWAAAAGLVAVAGGGMLATQGGDMLSALSFGGSSAAGSAAASLSAERAAPGDSAASGIGSPIGVTVVMTGQVVTSTGLASAAQQAMSTGMTPLHDLASESPAIGPIGTELGARDCATALGVPSDAALVVDLVTHDDSPAAVVVATLGGEHTAYLVRRNCRLGSAELISGPQRL